MDNQRGMTFVELLVVIALLGLVLVTLGTFAYPWIQREAMRSAVYDVQTFLALARVEAITRNRECRFQVDTATHVVSVFDRMDPADLSDDVLIRDAQLDVDIDFSRPGGGAPITLSQIGTTTKWEAVFRQDGIVTAGIGDIVLLGGERYQRVSVFGAGGTQVERWDNGAWHVGS
jgi:prepilin-type N-terminal cleavage/methylation domain-containing protein